MIIVHESKSMTSEIPLANHFVIVRDDFRIEYSLNFRNYFILRARIESIANKNELKWPKKQHKNKVKNKKTINQFV